MVEVVNKKLSESRNRRLATKIASEKGVDPVALEQSMDMGDIDFQMSIAPYTNYKGEIDPSVARYHGFTPEQQRPKTGLSLKGFAIAPRVGGVELEPYTYRTRSGEIVEIPKEPNTVNAVDTGATPRTWAHEYRHYERRDGSYEEANRLIDLATSLNEEDWKESLDFLDDQAFRNARVELKYLAKTDDEKQKIQDEYTAVSDLIQRNKQDPTKEEQEVLRDWLKAEHKWTLRSLYGDDMDSNEKFPMNRMFKKFMTEDL